MTYVQFISQDTLLALTSLDPNIQLQDLVPHILEAQDIFLQDLLGSIFYDVLQQQIVEYIATGLTSSFSPYYQNLIDQYCAPIVVQGTLFQSLPWIAYKMKAKGLFSGASEPGTYKVTTLPELTHLEDKAFKLLDFYKERLRRQLNLFTWKYPNYVNINNTYQNMPPSRQPNYGQGVAIPRGGSRTMNQQYGRTLELQGTDPVSATTGVSIAYEMYGPTPYNGI